MKALKKLRVLRNHNKVLEVLELYIHIPKLKMLLPPVGICSNYNKRNITRIKRNISNSLTKAKGPSRKNVVRRQGTGASVFS